jgi:hypothetical protein
MPQLLSVLPVCGQPQTLLDDGPDGFVLHVEHVLYVLGHRRHTNMEVGGLGVRHSLKTLLPYGVLLVTNQQEHDRHLYSSGETALMQGGGGDECHLHDGAIKLTANDGPHPRLYRVGGYHQADLTHVQAMGLRQAVAVERDVPIVPDTDECIV